MSLEELKAAIIADETVDTAEVEQLREVVYADGTVDKEEVKALFEINEICGDSDNAPEWNEFFIKAVMAYCLEDEATPGVVDAEEGKYIADLIGNDGVLDELEQELLIRLVAEADSIESPELTRLIELAQNAATA